MSESERNKRKGRGNKDRGGINRKVFAIVLITYVSLSYCIGNLGIYIFSSTQYNNHG